ncbi:MAG: 4-(cytidine 5'-diphospho)-2-C-methyl-D-erythritol kinase [Caulobacteraceae bacterium]
MTAPIGEVALEGAAPAKINLFLHVRRRAEDGYHPLSSLVVFADIGDRLTLVPAARTELVLHGPFAGDLPHSEANLALAALRRFESWAGRPVGPFRISLEKNLPVASGLGGGSSDAAAILRLLTQSAGREGPSRDALLALAVDLGADVPACIAAKAVIAEGRGERLSKAPLLPPLSAVLANPGAPCPTAEIFAAFDRSPFSGPPAPSLPKRFHSAGSLAQFLASCRNDLETPAVARVPQLGEMLALMREATETLLARVSGSGASAFAICPDRASAETLAQRIAVTRPRWWVRSCTLS